METRPPILEGNEFRLLWEEYLEPADRRRIRRAIRKGEPLKEPYWAAVAVSYARRELRSFRALAVFYFVMVVTIVAFNVWLAKNVPFSRSYWGAWFLGIGWIIWAVAFPILRSFWRRKFRQAEAANLAVIEQVPEEPH
jgi:hypothetical protein